MLYTALIDIRERSYENNDKASFWLSDLLHNIPMQLASEDDIKEAYESLREKIDERGAQNWFNKRKEEFHHRYPEYNMDF